MPLGPTLLQPGANDFRIGAWKNTTNTCLVAAVPWGPQGQQVFNVSGLGGTLQTTLLCRSREWGGLAWVPTWRRERMPARALLLLAT